jgi:sec-independent protein translocase protein TatA
MGLDNPLHLAFLLVILLLIFGAKRLPELGRSLGTGMRSFKESISGETHTEEPFGEIAANPAPTLSVLQVTEPGVEREPVVERGSVVERSPVRPAA